MIFDKNRSKVSENLQKLIKILQNFQFTCAFGRKPAGLAIAGLLALRSGEVEWRWRIERKKKASRTARLAAGVCCL